MARKKKEEVSFDRKNGVFVGLTDFWMDQLKDTFKGVNVEKELKKMCIWLMSSKGQLRKPDINFIMNWLSRIEPQFPVIEANLTNLDSCLGQHLDVYLKDLWKNREHVLALNTMHR